MDLEELLARESVRDLVARYNAGADVGRFDEVVALFAPDAVLEIPGETFEGRDAIAGLFRRTRDRVLETPASGGKPHLRHYTATLQIDVDGADDAHSRCYYLVLMAHGLDHWGRYIDRFRRVDGVWRFAHRKVTTDGRSQGSVMG